MNSLGFTRTTRTAGILTVLVAGSTLLAACGSAVDSADRGDREQEPVSLTVCGRDVVFNRTPERVVGLMPTQTDLLIRLGLHDSLIGQAQTAVSPLPADIADQAKDIPVISEDAPPAREKLLSVNPDLVVSPTSYEFTAQQGFADVEQLERSGAKVYIAAGGCQERRNKAEVNDVFTDIRNLGTIMKVDDAANRLVQEAQQRLTKVDDAVRGRPAPKVAQLYVEGNSLSAIGAGVEADIIRRAGGTNVFDPNSPEFASFFAAEINPEEVTARAPEVIVFGVTSPEHEKRTREYLTSRFSNVPAVRNSRLVAVHESDLHPGTLGNISAVETIARQLHTEAF